MHYSVVEIEETQAELVFTSKSSSLYVHMLRFGLLSEKASLRRGICAALENLNYKCTYINTVNHVRNCIRHSKEDWWLCRRLSAKRHRSRRHRLDYTRKRKYLHISAKLLTVVMSTHNSDSHITLISYRDIQKRTFQVCYKATKSTLYTFAFWMRFLKMLAIVSFSSKEAR